MINWLGLKSNYPAGHCQFCGYNLHSLPGEICPECGKSRLAWTEVKCEECGNWVVFAREDAGKLNECPSCGKTVDVPPAPASTQRPEDSIGGTRFSLVAFFTISFFVTVVSAFVITLLFALPLLILERLLGRHSIAPEIWLLSLLACPIIGIAVGLRKSYR